MDGSQAKDQKISKLEEEVKAKQEAIVIRSAQFELLQGKLKEEQQKGKAGPTQHYQKGNVQCTYSACKQSCHTWHCS